VGSDAEFQLLWLDVDAQCSHRRVWSQSFQRKYAERCGAGLAHIAADRFDSQVGGVWCCERVPCWDLSHYNSLSVQRMLIGYTRLLEGL
jgi:hypothetical protein